MARKQRGGGGDGGDDSTRWLGTYGDAITLLMAFFVMLYAMSQVDQVKFEQFVAGLAAPFGNPGVSILPESAAIVAEQGQAAPSPQDIEELLETVQQFPTPPEQAGTPQETPLPEQDLEQLEQIRQAITSSLEGAGMPLVAEYRFDERGLVVSIATDNVLFTTGSTSISQRGAEIIGAVAEPLKSFPNDVLIEGHTDNVPVNRSDYSNWNLSTDRAVAVLSFLYEQHGFDQKRLGAVGYGEHRPLVKNDSPEHRAQNRRVDILVIANGE